MSIHRWAYGPVITAAVLIAAQGAAAAQQAPESAAEQAAASDEIIVTAQKRAQNLQDVPIAITAIDGNALGGLQMNSGTEIARQTPNLSVSVLGNEDQPKFSIRGISQSEFNLNAASPTGIFYDEVFVRASFLGGAQLFDMDRVEVLRGPQGTLFGKETVGGAVSFITQAPVFEDEGYINGEFGNNAYLQVQGAANAVLVEDRLAARVAFNFAKSDGFVQNLLPGGRDKSDIDKRSARLSFKYQDDEGFDATLRVNFTRSSPEAVGTIVYGFLPGNTNAFGFNPRTDPATGRALGPREGFYDRQGRIRVRGDGAYLTLNKDFGSVTLTSISSYLKGYFLNEVDGDGSAANLLSLDFQARTEEFSQDLRLSTQFDGPFNIIGGVFFFKDTLDNTFRVAQFNDAFVANQSYRQERTSYAAYADGTFDFTDRFSAYAGIRVTRDEGKLRNFRSIVNIPGLGIPSTDLDYRETEPSGRVGLRFKATDDVMAYAQYSRGYRSSAFNGGAVAFPGDLNVANPEFLDAYEMGLKTKLFDRRVTLNISAFHYKFRDQQFINTVSLTQQQLVNAGRSRINGLEVELAARVTPELRVSAGLGLLDGKYQELTLNGIDLAGNRLIEAPKFSGNIAVDYVRPIGDGAEILLHGDAMHKSSQFFTAFNDTTFPQSLARADGFEEYNARAAIRFGGGKYEVGLWGKNLSNNSVRTGSGPDLNTGIIFSTNPYPRRYGIDFEVKF